MEENYFLYKANISYKLDPEIGGKLKVKTNCNTGQRFRNPVLVGGP